MATRCCICQHDNRNWPNKCSHFWALMLGSLWKGLGTPCYFGQSWTGLGALHNCWRLYQPRRGGMPHCLEALSPHLHICWCQAHFHSSLLWEWPWRGTGTSRLSNAASSFQTWYSTAFCWNPPWNPAQLCDELGSRPWVCARKQSRRE